MSVTDLSPAGHPRLRQLPVPACEPPYDDERAGGGAPSRPPGGARGGPLVQGTLALAFVLPSGLPASPQPGPALHLLNRPAEPPADESAAQREADAGDFGPQPTATAVLPPAHSWAGRVVQAIVEVLSGVRPVAQLVRWTTQDVYDEIAHRVLPGSQPAQSGPPRGVVRSVHVTEPADGVAEVCALVRRGARSTAVALRLEGMDGRWQCTALELG